MWFPTGTIQRSDIQTYIHNNQVSLCITCSKIKNRTLESTYKASELYDIHLDSSVCGATDQAISIEMKTTYSSRVTNKCLHRPLTICSHIPQLNTHNTVSYWLECKTCNSESLGSNLLPRWLVPVTVYRRSASPSHTILSRGVTLV